MRLPAAHVRSSRDASERSLTLLHVFLGASALILGVGAFVLSTVLTSALKSQAVTDSRESLSQYVDGVLGPALVRGNALQVGPTVSSVLLSELRSNPDLVTIKVWRPDGVLVWTNRGRDRIGKRFEEEGDLEQALHGTPAGSIGSLDEDENKVERALGFDHILQVYAPIRRGGARNILGAYEIYANPKHLETTLASRRHVLWAAVALVFFALWAALAVLVRGASSTLRRQTRQLRARSRDLMDSYRRLEESSLEAIESLNATVEAKDPDTAGHSLRVPRVALAIGEQLGLEGNRLDALRFGALFPDIGKIAIPDAILVKPAKLNYWEYAQMKTHSAEGARIVGKFGRLREAVPIIRHHHERWDGGGYPDGLGAEDIPLEARIVSAADAYSAMTQNRPYREARSVEATIEEMRRCGGHQFDPDVVEALIDVICE